MNHTIRIHDLNFTPFISHENIQEKIRHIADAINRDLDGQVPVFIPVLNGAFMFASDLLKQIQIPCEVSFIKTSSYDGVSTTGKVNNLIGLPQGLENRTVVLVEDIIDTGLTIRHLCRELESIQTNSVRVATLLRKPGAREAGIPSDYVGFDIGEDFVVGYGLDYNGQGRNLQDIYILKND